MLLLLLLHLLFVLLGIVRIGCVWCSTVSLLIIIVHLLPRLHIALSHHLLVVPCSRLLLVQIQFVKELSSLVLLLGSQVVDTYHHVHVFHVFLLLLARSIEQGFLNLES